MVNSDTPQGESGARLQRTIFKAVETRGKGLHSGNLSLLRLLPAPAGSGIRFRRIDLQGAPEIPATLDSIGSEELTRCTRISAGGAQVHTVEHVMAAAYALGIDNLIVEIDATETPFLDGSAKPFVELLESAGVVEQQTPVKEVRVKHPLAFRLGSAEVVALPSELLRVSFFFTSDNPLLRTQSASFVITPESFTHEIAPARTFCFIDEIEQLSRCNLIRGGSLASAVVIGRKHILNDSLRFANEPVRHKILDFVGDLALLGKPVKGHFLAWRSGHNVNAAFGNYLRKEIGFD